jgi:hypothetical protein
VTTAEDQRWGGDELKLARAILVKKWPVKTEDVAKGVDQLSNRPRGVECQWSAMQSRTFRLGSSDSSRMIVNAQIDDGTTANGILLRIRWMKSEFDVADIEPGESFVERNTIKGTIQQIGPPGSDDNGLLGKYHYCSHD